MNDQELLSRCAWCQGPLDVPFAQCVKVKDRSKIPAEGLVLFPITDAPHCLVPAIVCTEDSPAKAEGWDCVFALCSEACATNLRNALRQEADLQD